MRQDITNINFHLTTFCNMSCPDCCCNIPYIAKSEKRFFSIEYIQQAAKLFHGINRIHLTGGEPTAHPEFDTISQHAREWFGCEVLSLETNAVLAPKKMESLEHFDLIQISHYTAKSFIRGDYAYDNTEQVNRVVSHFAGRTPKIVVGEITHVDRSLRPGTTMCDMGHSETAAYCDGILYPCCVSPGIFPKIGIPLTENWRAEIKSVLPPCHNCFFAKP
jgi:organic radical activating enzyme